MARRLFFKRFDGGLGLGFRIGVRTYAAYLGYGLPIWWVPQFAGKGEATWGFGFGWLLLCVRFQMMTYKPV